MGEDSAPVSRQEPQQDQGSSPSALANRAIGVLILVIIIAVAFIYGWAGQIRLITDTSFPVNLSLQAYYGNLLFLQAIFVVIGFGLLFSYFKGQLFSGLFLSIYITSMTVLISPIIQKFWYNIFITNFKGAVPLNTSTDGFMFQSFGGQDIYVDFYNLRVMLAAAISQMVVVLAVIGRVSLVDVVLNSIFFNFSWNLCRFLCVKLESISPDPRIFDDYAINNVWIFGAFYGVIWALLLRKPTTSSTGSYSSSPMGVILASLGTFFLFLSFAITLMLHRPKYPFATGAPQIWKGIFPQEGFISIFFALSASVVFANCFSVLFGGRMGVRQSVIGTITGAIVYGPIAATNYNIAPAIVSGLAAGFLSAIFLSYVYVGFNSSSVKDSRGALTILVTALVGTLVITPIIIISLQANDVRLYTLADRSNLFSTITNKDTAGWMLVYLGISVGIGLGCGLIVGLFLMIIGKGGVRWFDDAEFFFRNYGLATVSGEYDNSRTYGAEGRGQSAQELNRSI